MMPDANEAINLVILLTNEFILTNFYTWAFNAVTKVAIVISKQCPLSFLEKGPSYVFFT